MNRVNINIDDSAGFCWGVVRTIEKVEEVLSESSGEPIYVLGEIIHNPKEIERLESKGLRTISHEDFERISPADSKVIIRAHGEPPSTYINAANMNICLIDATCPLVTALQKRVKTYYEQGFQIIIYGKKDHAEIIGLRGVCNDECIVVASPSDEALAKIDLTRKTVLFSQTTMNKHNLYDIKNALESKIKSLEMDDAKNNFVFRDTVCKYVYGREDSLRRFADENDVVLFVAGKNSSNGKSLYQVCHSINPLTYFIEDIDEINYSWFEGVASIGITGATSTPQWFMGHVRDELESVINK